MGRVSMPIMNKTGYSMYWSSMWDEKLNYSRSLFDDIFLKEFTHLLFENSNFMIHTDLKMFKKKLKKLKIKYGFPYKYVLKKNIIGNPIGYRVKKKRHKYTKYFSKVWILKYQTWVVILFYAYNFRLSIFYRRKIRKSIMYRKYYDLVKIYYYNMIKSKMNYHQHKNSFKECFF